MMQYSIADRSAFLSACAAALISRAAVAQISPGQGILKEVVVTAERVATSERKTPVSMEVLTQQDLSRAGISDLQTLTQADPSLNFAANNGHGFITMRGISGFTSNGPGAGPAVAVAFDDFYYNQNYIFSNALYDIKHIEVLRGPQGTLFGRNATGGLINIITNDPTDRFEGYGDLTFGDYGAVNAEGALNVPLSGDAAMRFAFASNQHAGYRTLYYGMGGVADDQDSKSGRVKLEYSPLQHLKILASYQFTHVGGAGTADNIFDLPAGANKLPTHVAIPITREVATIYDVAFASLVDIDDKLSQLSINYSGLPYGMSVTYLGGYDELTYLHTSPLIGLDAATAYGKNPFAELLEDKNPRTQNHELRLTSARDQRITWQAGLYYFHVLDTSTTHFRNEAAPSAPDNVTNPGTLEQRSTAAYGQADWHMGPTTLSAGARYTRDYVEATDLASPGDGVIPAQQSRQYSKWTWHVGEAWNVTDESLVYAKVDTGYRAGGFNLNKRQAPLTTQMVPYNPEYVTAYEVGSKDRLLNQHLELSADAFYTDFSAEQLPQSAFESGVFIVNAQKTNIYGVEIQAAALAGRVGRFDLNLNWLHARFDSQTFTNALGQSYGIGGNQLTQSPSVSLTGGFEHTFDLGNQLLTARVQTKYQSGQYFDFYNFADSYQPAYTRTDAHLIYSSDDERWSIDVFVRNIENSIVIADESESFSPPLAKPGTYNVGFQAPRTYGVTLSARF